MYLKHYNLTLKPFEINPDPKFLWLGEKHAEALAAMKYGILHNKGFISLTGNVGTGKTTLVNALANSLGDNIIFAQVPDPFLEQLDFFNLVADAFGMNQKFSTKGDFFIHLRHFLNNAYDHQQEVVLVIEEAQRFDQERLEEVRLISNIEKPDKKLINIICDAALLSGYAQEKKIIDPEIIRECAANCILPKQQTEDAIEDRSASSKSIPETGTGIQPGRRKIHIKKCPKRCG